MKYKKILKILKTLFFSDKVVSVSNYTKNKATSIINFNKEIDVIPNL